MKRMISWSLPMLIALGIWFLVLGMTLHDSYIYKNHPNRDMGLFFVLAMYFCGHLIFCGICLIYNCILAIQERSFRGERLYKIIGWVATVALAFLSLSI